jgi:hypothetical protein
VGRSVISENVSLEGVIQDPRRLGRSCRRPGSRRGGRRATALVELARRVQPRAAGAAASLRLGPELQSARRLLYAVGWSLSMRATKEFVGATA